MISVIFPIYNVLPYVEKCVRSVMNQSYRDLEILLIDDGSEENCLSVLLNALLESGAGMCVGDCRIENVSGKILRESHTNENTVVSAEEYQKGFISGNRGYKFLE